MSRVWMSRALWSQPQCRLAARKYQLEWEPRPLETRGLRSGLSRTGKTQTTIQPVSQPSAQGLASFLGEWISQVIWVLKDVISILHLQNFWKQNCGWCLPYLKNQEEKFFQCSRNLLETESRIPKIGGTSSDLGLSSQGDRGRKASSLSPAWAI